MSLLSCPGVIPASHTSLTPDQVFFKVAANSTDCQCFHSPWCPLREFVGLLQIVPQTVPVRDQGIEASIILCIGVINPAEPIPSYIHDLVFPLSFSPSSMNLLGD